MPQEPKVYRFEEYTFYNVARAALAMLCSPSTTVREFHRGNIEAMEHPSLGLLIKPQAIKAWFDSRTVKPRKRKND